MVGTRGGYIMSQCGDRVCHAVFIFRVQYLLCKKTLIGSEKEKMAQ